MVKEISLLHRIIFALQNHRVFAILLFFGLGVIAIGSFTNALKSIYDFASTFCCQQEAPEPSDFDPPQPPTPASPKNTVFKGIDAAGAHQAASDWNAVEIPLDFNYQVSPDRIRIDFIQSYIHYDLFYDAEKIRLPHVPEILGTPWECGITDSDYEIHVTAVDLDDDRNDEILIVLNQPSTYTLTGWVFKYFGAGSLDGAARDEAWENLGAFHGQSIVEIDNNKIFLPIGSSGSGNEYHIYQNKLMEWNGNNFEETHNWSQSLNRECN